MQKIIILVISIIVFPYFTVAQQIKVQRVNYYVDGEKIVITYDLLSSEQKNHDVLLKLKRENDSSFTLIPQKITGDYGPKVLPGKNKKVVWDIKNELKGKLKGFDYYFTVEAQTQDNSSSWYYWLGGIAGAGIGAATYFLLFDDDDDPVSAIADPPGRPDGT